MVGGTISRGRLISEERSPTYLDRWMVVGVIWLLVMLEISLIGWKIASIPVRSVLTMGVLSLFVLLYPGRVQRAIEKQKSIFLLAFVLGAIGVFVSLANGTGPLKIFVALLEVQVQAVVILLVATTAAEVAGPRAVMLSVVAAIAVSALVATLQFAGADAAWHLREMLGRLQGETMQLNSDFVNKRPMGVSYSPIQLATQLCLAFAAFTSVRSREQYARYGAKLADPQVIAALFALIAVSVVSGTRSPILGAALMLLAYTLRREGTWLPLMIFVFGGALAVAGSQIFTLFQEAQPRVVSVTDNSAVGRLALVKYGLLLFRDNPLGYGLAFWPPDHWMKFWPEVYTMQGADVIQTKALHNYLLTMLNTYGIGIVLIAPIAWPMLVRQAKYLIYFVPYIVHIIFHNTGPFGNDTVLWFVVGAISALPSAGAGRIAARSNPSRA